MRRASTVQKMALRGGYTTSALSQAHDTLTDEHLDGQRIFQRFDVDKNGTLNLDEARKALRFLGVREEMLASVIERIDTDADGRVTLEEWMSSIVAPLSKADQRLAFETELELKKRLSIEGGFRLASMNDQSLQSVSERFKRSKSREFLAYCLFCLVFTASTLIQASSQVERFNDLRVEHLATTIESEVTSLPYDETLSDVASTGDMWRWLLEVPSYPAARVQAVAHAQSLHNTQTQTDRQTDRDRQKDRQTDTLKEVQRTKEEAEKSHFVPISEIYTNSI